MFELLLQTFRNLNLRSRSHISRWKPVNESLAEFKEETEYLQV